MKWYYCRYDKKVEVPTMKPILLALLLGILFGGIVQAQAPDTIWTRRYNGPADGADGAQSCAVDGSGYLYVTGYSFNATSNDYLTVKYNASTGDTVWTRSYNGPANATDHAYDCTVDSLGYLYVTGGSYNGFAMDYLTIKYGTATGVENDTQDIPSTEVFSLFCCYPNPAKSDITVNFQTDKKDPVMVSVYNVSGQLVRQINLGIKNSGHHKVNIDCRGLSQGIYFYQLKAGAKSATKSFVLIK